MGQTNKKQVIRSERKLLNRQYGAKELRLRQRLFKHFRIERPGYWWRVSKLWQKICCVLIALVILIVGTMYGIAQWYIYKHKDEPLVYGVSFISSYAEGFGLNPQETMQAMIDDLGVRHFRLVSYWDTIEKKPGQYDFSDLDWQFAKANAAHATISLSLGLRQPRWPECHMPGWTAKEPKSEWYGQLDNFIAAVIARYKNNPALDSYQLENEYFLKAFGLCPDFSRDRLVNEFNEVKKLDPNHRVIITRSNNALGLPVGKPTPDEFGISVYKRVWDTTITHRYYEYPFPAWFYGFLAGAGEILTGKDMIIHELQAEPWPPNEPITKASIAEQNKSLDAKRLQSRFQYGKATGMREIDLWGAEYWYYRKTKLNDPSLWNVARQQFQGQQNTGAYTSE